MSWQAFMLLSYLELQVKGEANCVKQVQLYSNFLKIIKEFTEIPSSKKFWTLGLFHICAVQEDSANFFIKSIVFEWDKNLYSTLIKSSNTVNFLCMAHFIIIFKNWKLNNLLSCKLDKIRNNLATENPRKMWYLQSSGCGEVPVLPPPPPPGAGPPGPPGDAPGPPPVFLLYTQIIMSNL